MRSLLFIILSFCHASLLLAQQRPNIVLIFMDDMAWGDVSFNNPAINYTPNLQRLAESGIQASNFYVSEAVCTASRASFLTGSYTTRLGLSGALDHTAKTGLHPDEVTIADMLKPAGYHTAMYGKWHLGYQAQFLPTRQGFDEFYGIPYSHDMWPHHPETKNYYPSLPLYENEKVIDTISEASWLTKKFTAKATAFIRRHKDAPFFVYLAHPMPHVPLFVPASQNGKTGKGLYADVINEIDWSVGEVWRTLREEGLEENTLLIVTSDNGPWLSYGNHAGSTAGLREGKGTSWEGGVRVPFVAYWKGHIVPGRVSGLPMMTIDILPSIAAITGVALPANKIDGQNIWPVLAGTASESYLAERPLFFYYHRNDLESMRWKNWKLYFPHSYRSMEGQPQGADGKPGKYKMVKLQAPELYDLSADPYEKKNKASENPEVLKEMMRLADGIREQLGDDLAGIKGKENRPPGKVNE
ncbi:MAG TPA: sulfatase [Chitinophagaceae bacterium]|nr:sulfatase [Chitinophagaceae bacterium]